MNTLQVVPDIPVAREPVPRNTSLTPFISAEKWSIAISISMHSVNFAFVLQKASYRCETKVLTDIDLALKGS